MVAAADIGYPPGSQQPSVIIAERQEKKMVWSSLDTNSDLATAFATVSSKGKPVIGCYIDNTYSAASFIRSKTSAQVKVYRAAGDYVLTVPKTTTSARCGPPVSGRSAVYYQIRNPKRNTFKFFAKLGARQVLATRALNPRLRRPIFGIIPREPLQRSTLWVLARLGRKQKLYVLDRFNKWIQVSGPPVPKGSKITAIVAVQGTTQTFMVFQITNQKRESSYISVPIAADLL